MDNKKIIIGASSAALILAGLIGIAYYNDEGQPFEPQVREIKDEESDEEGKEKDQYVGLRNLGNTCYMNSLLQALSGSHVFVKYVANVFTNSMLERHKGLSRAN